MASSETMARVLAGQASYDELDARGQATLRRTWDERIAEDIARPDLSERCGSPGRPWAEADDDGNVIWRDLGAPARG